MSRVLSTAAREIGVIIDWHWPGIVGNNCVVEQTSSISSLPRTMFPSLPDDDLFVDFIGAMLTLDPRARPSAEELLFHPFLTEIEYEEPSSETMHLHDMQQGGGFSSMGGGVASGAVGGPSLGAPEWSPPDVEDRPGDLPAADGGHPPPDLPAEPES